MKRVRIISSTLVPSDKAGQPKILHRDSVVDVDDQVAGELVVAQRAVYDKDAKLKDTTKEHEAEADKRAETAAQSPQDMMVAMIGVAIAQAMAAAQAMQAKPAGA